MGQSHLRGCVSQWICSPLSQDVAFRHLQNGIPGALVKTPPNGSFPNLSIPPAESLVVSESAFERAVDEEFQRDSMAKGNRDMDSESILSRQTLALGECARAVASKLRTRMQSRPNRSEPVADILSFAANHMEQIGAKVEQFTDEVNQLGRLIAVADTPENAVHRGVARIEMHLERLLDDYDAVRRAIPGHADSEGCRLLEKVYRDTLVQIQDWLDETVECVNDPKGALKKRGLVLEEGKRVSITLDLDFEPPPSMNDFVRWTVQRGDTLIDEERASARKSRREAGCLGLLATFGLGWWLGSAGEDGDFDC